MLPSDIQTHFAYIPISGYFVPILKEKFRLTFLHWQTDLDVGEMEPYVDSERFNDVELRTWYNAIFMSYWASRIKFQNKEIRDNKGKWAMDEAYTVINI